MLATLRAHPLQLGESRVHGCCTHIQLKCKHRALKNSDPKTPSPTTETGGADTYFPSKKLSEKEMFTNACAGQSHPVGSLVSRGNQCLFPRNLSSSSCVGTVGILWLHFTNISMICLHHSQSQQLGHKEDPHFLS